MTIPKGCDQCRKSSLSLLLLRPSPIPNAAHLAGYHTPSIVSDPKVTQGLLPKTLPTESRFVLRLLRAGYVHVYLPKPPPSMKTGWLTFRVTDEGDLISEDRELFCQPHPKLTCRREEHNKVGHKVLTIPDAHKISELWIAFSANLWSSAIRAKNAANPAVMQRILLGAPCPNTFAPTVANLSTKVLECKLIQRGAYGLDDLAFPYHELFRDKGTELLAEYLTHVAKAHPQTAGKELAVVLSDPVGITAELNQLRVGSFALLKKELAKPKYDHPMRSSLAVDGLKKAIYSNNQAIAEVRISQFLTKTAFDNRGGWPAGTEWFELDAESKSKLPKQTPVVNPIGAAVYVEARKAELMGMVVYPDHERRAQKWTDEQLAKDWSDFAPYFDETSRDDWFRTTGERLKKTYEDPIERQELDWRAACDDPITLAYFKNHFDSTDPNDPKESHSPGATYAGENKLINTPEPNSKGSVLDRYLSQLDADITDERAILLRSIVGNQDEFFATVHKQLTADPGEGMRDKVYDILKDLKVTKKYSWLADGVGFYGYGQMSAVTAALISAGARYAADHVTWNQRTLKAMLLQGVQHTTEYLRKAQLTALVGEGMPNRPVLIITQVSAADLLDIQTATSRPVHGISKKNLKQLRKHNKSVRVVVMSDTNTIRANTDIKTILSNDTGQTARTGKASEAAKRAVVDVGGHAFHHDDLVRLANQQVSAGTLAAARIGNLTSGPSGDALSAVVNGIDGRLAIGCLAVQVLGFTYALSAYQKASKSDDKQARSEAELGLYDSTIGLTAAMVQIVSVGKDAYDISKHGASVAATRLLPMGLRAVGGIAGVAGAMISFTTSYRKQISSTDLGDRSAARLFQIAEAAFFVNILTSGAGTAGTVAQTAVARGVTNVVIRTVAARAGAGAVLATVGGFALSVSGIGLVLLGVGLAMQIGAIVLTPTAIQRWCSRSYFGRNRTILFFSVGNHENRFSTMADELKALDDIFPKSPAKTTEKK